MADSRCGVAGGDDPIDQMERVGRRSRKDPAWCGGVSHMTSIQPPLQHHLDFPCRHVDLHEPY